MDIRKLQRAIVDGLEDLKARHITVFNTEHLSALFERVIIASGASNRQTKALAASVRDVVRERGLAVMRTEGEENGEWIIVDCGAAVVHIMQPAIREYYHLEEIWGGKPVHMKLASAAGGLVKAAEEMPRSASTAASSRYVSADKAADKPAAKTVARTAAKKRASAKRPAAPRAPAAGSRGPTAAAGKRPAARKTARAGGTAKPRT